MKKGFYSIHLFAFMLAALGQANAQVSFTNKVSALTDPTHYSGVAMTVQDANHDGMDDLIILDQGTTLKIEYQGLNGVWTSISSVTMDNSSAWGMVAGDVTNNGHSDVLSNKFGSLPDYAKANATGTAYTLLQLPTYQLATQCVNLADMDSDGDLDFFSCGDVQPSGIWENDGSGNFTYSGDDIIQMTPTGNWDGSGNYGSTFTDYDLDGDLDLYITHCRQGVSSSSDLRRINQMFINDGNDNYTEDFTNFNGLRIGAQSWTTDFQDFDNDGDFDAFITNHDVNNMLLENQNGVFVDIFDGSGLDMSVGTPIQGLMRDFDNDMYVDIIVTGSSYAFYRNNGDNTFTKINNIFGNGNMESLAIGDLNHDGFLDVYGGYANIYTTPTNTPDALWINDGNDNNWIAVELTGTISNRSAVGAVVRVYGPWGMQVREVRAGESYGICNTLIQHFGLAQNTEIDSVVIDWPSSDIHQVIEDVAVNQFLSVIENQCVAPQAFITSNGPTVLCAGQSLLLDAPAGSNYSYEWSTGETTPSISIDAEGIYMVRVTDNVTGCRSVSASIQVEVSPDETPTVSVSGDLLFCEGESVTLTSSSAAAYTWSNGLGSSQSVDVTESGDYYVTITGVCDDFSSDAVTVTVLAAPAPTANDQLIPVAGSTDITASGLGTEFNWYDASTGGNLLGTGATFTTPVVTTSNTFYVEEVVSYPGVIGHGAKTNNTTTGGAYHQTTNFYLIFDVLENMTLKSVKVYAENQEVRTIYIEDSQANVIHTGAFDIPQGESRVYLTDWALAPGTDYRIRVQEANHGLWRDNSTSEVNYPYDVNGLATITTTNANPPQYYYYFYDWEVESASYQCVSERTPVTVTVGTVGIEEGVLAGMSLYPNPSNGFVNVVIPTSVEGTVSIQLMDVAGNLIETHQVVAGTTRLDVSNLASGVYLLKLDADNGTAVKRITVQ